VRDRPKNNARAPQTTERAAREFALIIGIKHALVFPQPGAHVTMAVHVVRSLIICKCDRRVFYYVRAR
jgi:hypothetical protein